jgi:hypothetical protein
MSKKSALLLLCGLVLSGNSLAMSGKEYLDQCSLEKLKSLDKPAYGMAITFCTSLVRGVIEGHYATTGYYEKDRLFCVPPGKTYMDLTGEVVGRLGVEQKFQDKPFGGLAIIYLGRAFPCEKKQ